MRVSFAGRPRGFVDEALAALGRSRRVVLTVNQFATAARVVHDSDLLSVLPRSFVAASGLADGLVVRAVPFDLPPIEVGLLWHRRHERDPAQRWLRETVEDVVKGLGIGEPRGRSRRSSARRSSTRPDPAHAIRAARSARENPPEQATGAAMAWFDGFDSGLHPVGDVELFARIGGDRSKPPLLLLHGYPQTHAMWHRVARDLAADFCLVIPDLRGYGDSTKPAPAATPELDHAQHSKRAMARRPGRADALARPRPLRGGRPRPRRPRRAPARARPSASGSTRLAVIDIVPTLDMYEATDMRFASWYYHWFFLIQPAPLPERMIGADPGVLPALDARRVGQRTACRLHRAEALAEYERCFSRADTIHAACEDYRASASIDLEHDRASRAAGEKIACAMLVLWGTRGVVGRLYDPLALWRAQCAASVEGDAMASRPLHPRRAACRHRSAARRLPGDTDALSGARGTREGRRRANGFTLSPGRRVGPGLPSPPRPREERRMFAWISKLDHHLPIRYAVWALCIVGFVASAFAWCADGDEPSGSSSSSLAPGRWSACAT